MPINISPDGTRLPNELLELAATKGEGLRLREDAERGLISVVSPTKSLVENLGRGGSVYQNVNGLDLQFALVRKKNGPS
jgi:hypothetical protein